jgi:type I restriction enzyme S subunit
MLGKLVFLFPSRAEQNAIGEYLEHLDQIITLQTRKLETLKRLKQFMLQNLFV